MDTGEIREAILKRPFTPFKMRMNDGREFFVPHPEFVAVSKQLVIVIDPQTSAGIHLEPLLIASLEFVEKNADAPQESGKDGNGPA